MFKTIQFLLIILLLAACGFKKERAIPEGFELVWKNDSVRWNASSVIENKGYLYGLTLNGELFKIDIGTGKVIWIRKTLPNYAFQEPSIIDDKIFVGGRGAILSFDLNGKLLWEQKTGEKIGHTLLYNDSLLFGSLRGAGMYAFNQKTGTVAWSIVSEQQLLSTNDPTIKDSLLIVGDFHYGQSGVSSLYCFNIINGKEVWNYPTEKYLTSAAEVVAAKAIVNIDYGYETGFTNALDLYTGKLLWQTKTYPSIFVKPTYLADKLYVSSYKFGLVCLNPENGKTIWQLALNDNYPDTKFLLHNDNLIFGTWKSQLCIVDLSGVVKSRSYFEYGIGNPFEYNSTLYVPVSGGQLYRQVNEQALPK